jgi:hypothetical protein
VKRLDTVSFCAERIKAFCVLFNQLRFKSIALICRIGAVDFDRPVRYDVRGRNLSDDAPALRLGYANFIFYAGGLIMRTLKSNYKPFITL